MAVIIDPRIKERENLVDSINFFKGLIETAQLQLAAAERSVAFNASIGQTSIVADRIPEYRAEIAEYQTQLAAEQKALQQFDSGTTGATDAPDPVPVENSLIQDAADVQVEANTAAAQPFPYGDDATGVDAQVAANTPAAQFTPNQTLDPAQAAKANRVRSTTAAAVDQNDAETARLARLNLAATPNEFAAETNRLIEKNVEAVVGTKLAQRQAVLDAQRKMVNNGDWRVRLSLAAGADYLYNASSPGILAPLAKTGGVIFPYTPKIETVYKADYESVALTHSNYKGYFYKGSYNDTVTLSGTFTAQDTTEADYLLAVIHFFRSVTKMFYGQDAQRGAPPPLVYLTGLGQYQFSAHPCVVTSFTYNLPNDVDYIRAGSTNINGTNLTSRRVRQDLPTDPITGAIKRLANLFSSQGINKGAITNTPAPPTLGKNSPTYVPTKMEISLSLLPMQSRSQVSQVFNLKGFANGDLIKGGFW